MASRLPDDTQRRRIGGETGAPGTAAVAPSRRRPLLIDLTADDAAATGDADGAVDQLVQRWLDIPAVDTLDDSALVAALLQPSPAPTPLPPPSSATRLTRAEFNDVIENEPDDDLSGLDALSDVPMPNVALKKTTAPPSSHPVRPTPPLPPPPRPPTRGAPHEEALDGDDDLAGLDDLVVGAGALPSRR